ncbi:hypothetical protein NT6N_22020 [Oceaniferula spumae]|uniref:YHS domain-containing protein n=1 Tax=Oceaniferula spumae TaxID=2979115 RepID=A0AAT9FM07_9BACT
MRSKYVSPIAAALLATVSLACTKSASGTKVTVEKSLVNTSGVTQIAINGFDPVAFFTEGKAVHGEPEITSTHEGAVYMFASHEHKESFNKEPGKYLPQYGGFSALAASYGSLLPVDISTWKVRDGKLYLDLNPEYADDFHADFASNVEKADAQWPKLIEKNKELNAANVSE